MAELPKTAGITVNVTPKIDVSALAKSLADSLRLIADSIEGK